MAKETYNLNQISKFLIHRPSSESKGQIFYVPLNSSASNIAEEQKLFKDSEWLKNKDKFMSSPTNVRKLWITYKGITIETYAGMISNGKQTNLITYKAFKDSDFKGEQSTDFISLAKAYLKQQLHKNTTDSRDLIAINNNIVSNIRTIWTFNNIEEIYFDWSVLLCNESIGILSSYLNKDESQIIQTVLAMVTDTEQLSKGIPSANVKGCIGSNTQASKLLTALVFGIIQESSGVPKTFKRLSKIAMISDLSLLVNEDKVPYAEVFDENLFKQIAESKTHTYKTWIDKLRENQQQSNNLNTLLANSFIIEWSRKVNLADKETFLVKDANYVFDQRHLKEKLKKFNNYVHDIIIAATKEKLEKTDDTKALEEEISKVLELESQKESASIPPILEIARQIVLYNSGIEKGASGDNGAWVRVLGDTANINGLLLQRLSKFIAK